MAATTPYMHLETTPLTARQAKPAARSPPPWSQKPCPCPRASISPTNSSSTSSLVTRHYGRDYLRWRNYRPHPNPQHKPLSLPTHFPSKNWPTTRVMRPYRKLGKMKMRHLRQVRAPHQTRHRNLPQTPVAHHNPRLPRWPTRINNLLKPTLQQSIRTRRRKTT